MDRSVEEEKLFPVSDFVASMTHLQQIAKDAKRDADDSDSARRWAIVYTELEKVYAYYKTFLSED